MIKLNLEQHAHVTKAVTRHEEDLEACLAAIPSHCRLAVRKYILYGQPFGDFLTAAFANNFQRAATAADDINALHLADYARLMYNAPRDCWGSIEKINAWISQGGLTGVYAEMITRRSSVVVDDEAIDFRGRRLDD